MVHQHHQQAYAALSGLPFEILLAITDNLLLSDIISLGCAAPQFLPVCNRQCDIRHVPEEIRRRLLVLRRYENSARHLVKSHRWNAKDLSSATWTICYNSQNKAIDSRLGVFLHKNTYLAASLIQLVKRAQLNQAEGFGFPIDALYTSFTTDDGWNIATQAVYTKGNSLIIRVQSTAQLDSRNTAIRIHLCECAEGLVLDARNTNRSDYGKIINAQLAQGYINLGQARTVEDKWLEDRWWYECRACLAIISRSLSLEGTRKGLLSNAWLRGDVIELTRYYDLGPVFCLNNDLADCFDPVLQARLEHRKYAYLPGRGYYYVGYGELFKHFSAGRLHIEASGPLHWIKRYLAGRGCRCHIVSGHRCPPSGNHRWLVDDDND